MARHDIKISIRAWARTILELYFRFTQQFARRDVLVICYAWPDFARKARALATLFREQGIETELIVATTAVARAKIRVSRRLHVGFWNEFYPEALPRHYVCYNAEPLTLARWNASEEWLTILKQAADVWNYAPHHNEFLQNLGVPHRYVPFGFTSAYAAEFEANLAGQSVVEDIDVLFYGHLTPRRAQLMKDVEAAGCRLHVVTYENPARGAALDLLIARSKIVLSVFAVDDPGTHNVDFARLDYLLSSKRFVIQEQSPDALRDIEFEQHVETCNYADIATRCAWYVRNERERQQKATQSHRWFSTHRSWASIIPFAETRALMNRARV